MISHQEALIRLIEGNERFAKHESSHPNRCDETKELLLSGQKPYVAVLACSDSRVPVEIVFDAGLGDIFAVRTAGHVLSNEVMGSLEYAVKSLGVKLVVILGHENCGAIKKAIQTYEDKSYDELSENLQSIMNHLYPAIETVECDNPDFCNAAVEANIRYQMADLLNKDPYILEKVEEGKIAVIGAIYALATGKVKFLD